MVSQNAPDTKGGANKQGISHASMPDFVVWIQDHLLLTLLILASGYVNGIMLVDGWVRNIDDANTWGGWFHGSGVPVLFVAGLALGGLGLRISYKMSECISQGKIGRALFLAFGMTAMAVIEFWASFSQRSANIPATPADNALLGAMDIHNPGVSLTAILISVVVPFVSVFWGFAAEDPAPRPVEDPAVLQARLQNELMVAEFNARKRAVAGKGLRGAINGVMGREDPVDVVTQAAEMSSVVQEETPETPARIAQEPAPLNLGNFRGKWWDAPSYKAYIWFAYGVNIHVETALRAVQEVGNNARAPGKAGAPYIASITKLKGYAKRLYGDPQPGGMAPDMAGQYPE